MPFLGYTTQGVDSFPCSGDRALLSAFQATEDGTIIGWQAYFDATSGAGDNVKCIVYDESGGAPNALVAVSTAVAVPGGGGLVTGAMPGAAHITNGAFYFIGIVADSFNSRLSETLGIGGFVRGEPLSYASPPSTWPGTADSGVVQFSVAVEFEPMQRPIRRPLILRPRPFMPGLAR